MSEDQINEVDKALQSGKTPEQVAQQLGLNQNALRYQLLTSGKRIVTYRKLEDTAPASKPREMAAA